MKRLIRVGVHVSPAPLKACVITMPKAYAISHDAHHRGRICQLARQTGHDLPKEAGFGM